MYRNRQSGSVLIVAIFVIVVMGMLGLTLTRLEWANQDTLTREVLGTQAWFVAHSGNEWGLTNLFPLGQSAATSCPTTFGSDSVSAASSILTNSGAPCGKLEISCQNVGSGELLFMKVKSVAVCGSSEVFEVSREQEVWARGIE